MKDENFGVVQRDKIRVLRFCHQLLEGLGFNALWILGLKPPRPPEVVAKALLVFFVISLFFGFWLRG